MKPRHAVSLIESAYRVDLSTNNWLEGLAAASAAALGSTQGAMAFRYDATPGNWVHNLELGVCGLPPEFAREFFDQSDLPQDAGIAMVKVFTSTRFGSVKEFVDGLGQPKFSAVFNRYGIEEMVGVNGLDPSQRGCMVVIAASKRAQSARAINIWHRLSAHIAAGNRLRTVLEGLNQAATDPTNHAEAVLSPNGKVEHVKAAAEPRSAREALQSALARIDAARSEKDDVGRSVDLWRGLIAGRWSLVEHFERDGRRYFLAQKNDPLLAEDRVLTTRERQVLGYAKLGHSNKLIAYELGLSTSAVSSLLARAKRKAKGV